MKSIMKLATRRELLHGTRKIYKKASWKEKHAIINSFIAATGYRRKYAIGLLNRDTDHLATRQRRKKECQYDEAVRIALTTVWRAANEICSKRLVPFLPEFVTVLERHGHLSIPTDVRQRLISVSAATVDRILKPERQKRKRGIGTTKPGSLLKRQIQVRTFTDWNDVIPGFFEADLVAHCGDHVSGTFLNTLVLTDIATGWTEFFALLRKSSTDVISGLQVAQQLIPFPILGLDVDNGSEFINYDLMEFCKKNKITFTRSRAYRKNDQAHVEEKNGSIVRRIVGYDRYESEAGWKALADLYSILRLYTNYFQPSMKLISKERDGQHVTKRYDKAKTPYQRLIVSKNVSKTIVEDLTQLYETLDPVQLLEDLMKSQDQFWLHAWEAERKMKDTIFPQKELTAVSEIADLCSQKGKNKEISIPARQYRRTKKPRKPRNWRTRKDPFESVSNEIYLTLNLNPIIMAKSLLENLMHKYPGKYKYKHLRTLQRRVAEWRKEHVNQEVKYKEVLISKQPPISADLGQESPPQTGKIFHEAMVM